MSRNVWCIPQSETVDQTDLDAAEQAGCSEVAVGVPRKLLPYWDGTPLPCKVTEPDAPPDLQGARADGMREALTAALTANRAWLPQTAENPTGRTTAPNLAATVQQVDRLTRQNVALIRLVVGLLDGTD